MQIGNSHGYRFFTSPRTAVAMGATLAANVATLGVQYGTALPQSIKDWLSMLLVLISLSALIFSIYWEVKRAIDHVINVSHGGFENRFISLSHQAFQPLTERLKKAINVKNTFIDHREVSFGGTSNPYTFYSEPRMKLYEEFFQAEGKLWIDVVSKTTVLSNSPKFSSKRTRIAQATRKKKKEGGDYQTFVLKQSTPAVNFIILENSPDEDKEVLWGWGFHSEEPSASVFLSRDARVVQYFDKLFDSMVKDAAENLEDKGAVIYYERRWIGAWVEKSFLDDTHLYWVVRVISFERFGLSMSCTVMDSQGVRLREYKTADISLERRTMVFTFETRDCPEENSTAKDPGIFTGLHRRGYGRFELEIPNDGTNFWADENRRSQGFVMLTGPEDGAMERVKVSGHRVKRKMLNALKAVAGQRLHLDESEEEDSSDDDKAEQILLDLLQGVLSKLSPQERVAWMQVTFDGYASQL
jgi:hypothetical protein